MRELHFRYDDYYKNKIDYLASRITAIIDSDTRKAPQIFLKEDGSFQLGDSNDWRLYHHPETQEISVTYKYGSGYDPRIEALGEFLAQFLVLGWTNRPLTPAQRIREIVGGDLALGKKTSFEYSWYCGSEKLKAKHDVDAKGGSDYSGSYHPNASCEGEGICEHCGKTLFE